MTYETDPDRWGLTKIERPARRIIDSGLGEGRSHIDPDTPAWDTATAKELRARLVDNADTGRDRFAVKLRKQLDGAPRAVSLLAVELLALHVLPLGNVNGPTKLARVSNVLSWIDPPAQLPTDLRDALDGPGIFNGGVGFNIQIWQQLGWLLAFIEQWNTLPPADRHAALTDPWIFRDFADQQDTGQIGIRNSLLYLAFPTVFLPITRQQDKVRIRAAFADVIDRPTATDAIAVDRDLHDIHRAQLAQMTDKLIHYYREPWLSRWAKHKPTGDAPRTWHIRTRTELTSGAVSIPAEHLGVLPPDVDRAQLDAAVEAGYHHLDYVQRLTLSNDYHHFLNTMKVDDLLAVTIEGHLHVGVVTGDPEPPGDDPTHLRRTVAWTPTALGTHDDLPPPLRTALDRPGTVVDITDTTHHLTTLLSPADVPDDLATTTSTSLRPPTRQLADELHIDLPWLDKAATLLQARKQIVLHGPPGTGKTYLARALAHHFTDPDAVRLVQFHPSYAYEDFFEGFRPAIKGDTVGFKLVPGPLRRLAAAAEADKARPYILVIDEINRANLAKVFGELYFLLEYRGEKIDLQYSTEEPFTLPDNIYFIGTMNSADRSISLVDSAMRRRFAFLELHPDEPPVHGLLDRWATKHNKTDDRAALLTKLNAAIANEDRDFKIGPSYLMKPEADRIDGMDLVWEHSILPLLEQHYHHLGRTEVHAKFGLRAIRAAINPTTP